MKRLLTIEDILGSVPAQPKTSAPKFFTETRINATKEVAKAAVSTTVSGLKHVTPASVARVEKVERESLERDLDLLSNVQVLFAHLGLEMLSEEDTMEAREAKLQALQLMEEAKKEAALQEKLQKKEAKKQERLERKEARQDPLNIKKDEVAPKEEATEEPASPTRMSRLGRQEPLQDDPEEDVLDVMEAPDHDDIQDPQ